MKAKIIYIALLAFLFSAKLFSQEHPTVQSLEILFKIPPGLHQRPDSIMVYPEASIVLSTTENVSKLHLKIKNSTTGEFVYQTFYDISSSLLTDENGRILFARSGSSFTIGSPDQLRLESYVFEVLTEDTDGNLTQSFSKAQ